MFSVRRPPPPQQLLLLMSKPFELNLRYLRQRTNRPGKMYWMSFPWPWPEVATVTLMNKNVLVCMIKWQPLIQSLQNLPLSHAHYPIRFWKILWETFWRLFFSNFGCVFSRSTTIEIISGMVVSIDVKQQEVDRLDKGWTMWPWPLISPMTLTLTFFKVTFQNS